MTLPNQLNKLLMKDSYTIAGLLIIGNLWPGYAMAKSMMRDDEN